MKKKNRQQHMKCTCSMLHHTMRSTCYLWHLGKKVQIILLFLCTTLTERQVLKWTHETVSICRWFSTENDYLSNDFGGKMANDPKQTVQPNESNHFAWVIFITAEIAAYLFLCSTIKNWISVETDYERKKCCVATQNEGNLCKKWEFE